MATLYGTILEADRTAASGSSAYGWNPDSHKIAAELYDYTKEGMKIGLSENADGTLTWKVWAAKDGRKPDDYVRDLVFSGTMEEFIAKLRA
jgi:hypothetical protein